MSRRSEDRWLNRRVRRKNVPGGPIGTVVDKGKFGTWWLVEWPDGKRTQDPERSLVVVPEGEYAARLKERGLA
jgi:hypothetical protein